MSPLMRSCGPVRGTSCTSGVTSSTESPLSTPSLKSSKKSSFTGPSPVVCGMARRCRERPRTSSGGRDASEVGVTEQGVWCLKIVLPTNGLPGCATRLGELPEHVQGLRDLTGEGDRIERRELSVERGALSGGEDPRGEDSLVRSPWGVVAFVDTAADPALAQEFADGAEEVVVEAKQGVEALQGGPRRAGAVAVIADEAADQQAIALLDPGLVIFA